MSLATLCIPTGRHEKLQPGQKCANCGMSYESDQEIKRIVKNLRSQPTPSPKDTE